eukprot:3258706-Alexandrium_andersonii.AAC.1
MLLSSQEAGRQPRASWPVPLEEPPAQQSQRKPGTDAVFSGPFRLRRTMPARECNPLWQEPIAGVARRAAE